MEEIKKIGHAAFRKEALGNHIILHCDLRHCRVSDKLDSETARLYLRAITELADADALLLVDLRDSKGTFPAVVHRSCPEVPGRNPSSFVKPMW